jgi:polysaccharide biosynthesis transport protein
MDRILQPHSPSHTAPRGVGATGRPVVVPHPIASGHAPAPQKSAGDFLRALRRRIWIVLIVATAVAGSGSAWVVRQPDVYRATAQILIEPPRFDAAAINFLNGGGHAGMDQYSIERYVPNKIAFLRSRALAEFVVAEPSNEHLLGSSPEPAQEISDGIQPRMLPLTTIFDVSLEDQDPERAAGLLEATIKEFERRVKDENSASIDESKRFATKSLKQFNEELKGIDTAIDGILKETPIFSPTGKSLLEEELVQTKSFIMQKRIHFDELSQEDRMARLYPALRKQETTPLDRDIAELRAYKKQLVSQLQKFKEMISAAKFDNDVSTRFVSGKLEKVMDELEELEQQRAAQIGPDPTGASLALAGEEIRKLEQRAKGLMDQMQRTMPQFQSYLTKLKERDQKLEQIYGMQRKYSEFDLLSQTLKKPVTTQRHAVVPTTPVRPKRAMLIAVFSVLGLALGMAFVCFLEFLDHSVKVPEHLTAGLGLPILGVVPRMRRLARMYRGGHLWTPGIPRSIEADAYRNLRASLLSLPGREGSVVTLLVTSAKAGEGKSTTALNLAATCAKAGERTLLIDCDLRRPSLGEVFTDEEEGGDPEQPRLGLVDVLRGELPWQRTLRRTGIPNLDFMPAGDPTGIPIEILGSLELRQLIVAVSGHYHRVIIDGPAVLGMADCRMLGRLVDTSVMVVRSGAHELRPLMRARAMLEQSRVPLAGLVFNGITDDLDNWSSYGSGYVQSAQDPGDPETSWTAGELSGRSSEPAAAVAGQLGA